MNYLIQKISEKEFNLILKVCLDDIDFILFAGEIYSYNLYNKYKFHQTQDSNYNFEFILINEEGIIFNNMNETKYIISDKNELEIFLKNIKNQLYFDKSFFEDHYKELDDLIPIDIRDGLLRITRKLIKY